MRVVKIGDYAFEGIENYFKGQNLDRFVKNIEILDGLPNGTQMVKVLSELIEHCGSAKRTAIPLTNAYLHEGVQKILSLYGDLEGSNKITEGIARLAYKSRAFSSHDGFSDFGSHVDNVFGNDPVVEVVKGAQNKKGVEQISRAMAMIVYKSVSYCACGGDGYWHTHDQERINSAADELKERGLIAAEEINKNNLFYAHCLSGEFDEF
jgi:hypothetical protein